MTAADLQRHPLSAAFGTMPKDELDALVADIKKNGLVNAIVYLRDKRDPDKKIVLDGWHRYRACIAAGVEPRLEPFDFVIEAAAEQAGRKMTPAEFVIAQNAHRRHLSREQRRQIVAELLKAKPEASDRAIAGMASVSDKTVGAVRRELEAGAEIPHLAERVGRDGKTQAKPSAPPPMTGERRAELDRAHADALQELADATKQADERAAALRASPAPQEVWAEISGSLNAVADRLRSVRRRMAGRHPDYPQPLQRPTAASAEPLQAALISVFDEFDRMAATAREYLVEAAGEWTAARVVMTLDDPDRNAAMLSTCYRLAGFKQLHAAIGRRIESLQAREAARLQATQEEAAA